MFLFTQYGFAEWAVWNPHCQTCHQKTETTNCWWCWPAVAEQHVQTNNDDTNDEQLLDDSFGFTFHSAMFETYNS